MIYSNLEIEIEKSKDNIDILKVKKNNKFIYIGSKYNMTSQINKFINNIKENTEKSDILFIYGFGSENAINMLSENMSENKIVVFEPNLKLKDYIEDIQWIEQCDNLEVLCDYDEKISDFINIHNIDKIKIYSFLNYENIYDLEYNHFRQKINTIIKNCIIDSNTRILFNQRWFEATLRNIPFILDSHCVNSFKDKLKDKPAIIVSAGPSLAKNIEELKKVKNNLFIISGGRTLKPLIDKNIEPHLLSIVDSGEPSYLLVEDYIDLVDVPLLFFEKTNERIIEAYANKKKIFFTQSDIIRQIEGEDIPNYICGGSVAHTMTKAAIELGCNPIIFIGQDLAYTDDKEHAEIAKYKKVASVENKKNDITDSFVEAVGGGTVRTGVMLNAFRLELENLISEHPHIEFINATEGGARIKGTKELSLKHCIEEYATKNIDFHFENITKDKKNNMNAKIVLQNLKESINLVFNNSKKSLRLLEDLKLSYIMKKQNKVNAIIEKLNIMDKEIEKECKKFLELENVLYPIMHKTIIRNNNNMTELEFTLYNSRVLYEGIICELENIKPVLDKVIDILD